MRVQYENKLLDAFTVSASTSVVANPVSFVYDQYLTNFLLFTGKTSEYILVDAGFGSTLSISSIGLAGFNLTSSATITLQGNATNVWTSPSFSQVITWKSGTITQFLSATQTYRYFRVLFQDSTNTSNIQIGYLYLGGYVDFPGFLPSVNITNVFSGNRNITRSGQISGSVNYEHRRISVIFPQVTNTQRNQILAVAREMYTHKTLFLSIWHEDFTTESAIYGVIDTPNITQPKEAQKGVLWNVPLSFREAK